MSFLQPTFPGEEVIPAVAIIFKPDPRAFETDIIDGMISPRPGDRSAGATAVNHPTSAPRFDKMDGHPLAGDT